MKSITKLMIREFNIKELGYDFMGYVLRPNDVFTFHHLIITNKLGGTSTIDNGAILVRRSHTYLHLIEALDYLKFCYITSEMINMNVKRSLDINSIKIIDEILSQFEYENRFRKNIKDEFLIKEEYKTRILKR